MDEVIKLNVGGDKFTTSKQTLRSIPETFFTSLLSGRIPLLRDGDGSIFIDRDPKLFQVILNFLRTKELDTRDVDLRLLRLEAEFYGVQPLVKRLQLCEDQDKSSCGDLMFHGMLQPPSDSILFGDGELFTPGSKQVLSIVGHQNWLAVAYCRCVCCYNVKELVGWKLEFISPLLEEVPEKLALNAKVIGSNRVDPVVAVVTGSKIRLWSCLPSSQTQITSFDMGMTVDAMFFIGSQLVAISHTGKVVVWHAMTEHWQKQSLNPITSYDTAGSFLLLGCANGCISYIDMEKFPLRLKDNELLVNQLYEDPDNEAVTSLSVYLTPNICSSGNWIEIAYGTSGGCVRIIVQHPETVRQGPQLFQTFTVHCSPIVKVKLSEKHLVSVCSEMNHVRSWSITRFRGRISTQPGSTPIASYKVISLEDADAPRRPYENILGPFGHGDEEQVFVQKVVPETDQLFIRQASSGHRICIIQAVDGSNISAYCVHECDSANRMGARSKQFVITGHSNGSVQMWDLSTATELHSKRGEDYCHLGGPSQQELLRLMSYCDLSTSRLSSAEPSRANSERSLVTMMTYTPQTLSGGLHMGRSESFCSQISQLSGYSPLTGSTRTRRQEVARQVAARFATDTVPEENCRSRANRRSLPAHFQLTTTSPRKRDIDSGVVDNGPVRAEDQEDKEEDKDSDGNDTSEEIEHHFVSPC